MTRFLQTLAWSLAATFVVALFLPNILLVALVLAIGRATDRRLKTVVAQGPVPSVFARRRRCFFPHGRFPFGGCLVSRRRSGRARSDVRLVAHSLVPAPLA